MDVIHGVTKGSVVFTQKGYAYIEDLEQGALVSSGSPHDQFNPVQSIYNTPESVRVISVKLEDGFSFKVTPDLPFLTPSGDFVVAKSLKKGDEVCNPIFDIPGTHSLDVSDILAKAIARGLVLKVETGEETFDFKIVVADTTDSEVQKFLTAEMQGFLGSLLENKPAVILTKLLPFILKGLDSHSALQLITKVYAEAVGRQLIFSDYKDALVVRSVMYSLGLIPQWTDFGSYAVGLKSADPYDGLFVGVEVESVEEVKDAEDVYSVSLDVVHRYCVNGSIVHNRAHKEGFISQNDIISEQRGELLKDSMPDGNYVMSDLGLQLTGVDGVKKIMTGAGVKDLTNWVTKKVECSRVSTVRGHSLVLPNDSFLLTGTDDMKIALVKVADLSHQIVFVNLNPFDSKQHADKSVLVEESARKSEFPPYVLMLTNPIKWIYMRHWFLNHGRVTDEGLTVYFTTKAQRTHLLNVLASLGVSVTSTDDGLVVDCEHELRVVKETKLPIIYDTDLKALPPERSLFKTPEIQDSQLNNKVIAYDNVFKVEPLGVLDVILPEVDAPSFVLNSILVSTEGVA